MSSTRCSSPRRTDDSPDPAPPLSDDRSPDLLLAPTPPDHRGPALLPGELRRAEPSPLIQRGALVRLVDSAFPPDGFAEATAFEEACRAGRVSDARGLTAFVEGALRDEGGFALRFVRATLADPGAHAAADRVCDAALADAGARRASREKGQAFLAGAAGFSPAVGQLVAEARRERLAGHLAPAFGAVLGLLGAGSEDACRLFLYLGTRGIFSVAVRLGLVGPLEAHARLTATTPTLNAVLLERPALRSTRRGPRASRAPPAVRRPGAGGGALAAPAWFAPPCCCVQAAGPAPS